MFWFKVGQLLFNQGLELYYDPIELANGVNAAKYDKVDRSIILINLINNLRANKYWFSMISGFWSIT